MSTTARGARAHARGAGVKLSTGCHYWRVHADEFSSKNKLPIIGEHGREEPRGVAREHQTRRAGGGGGGGGDVKLSTVYQHWRVHVNGGRRRHTGRAHSPDGVYSGLSQESGLLVGTSKTRSWAKIPTRTPCRSTSTRRRPASTRRTAFR